LQVEHLEVCQQLSRPTGMPTLDATEPHRGQTQLSDCQGLLFPLDEPDRAVRGKHPAEGGQREEQPAAGVLGLQVFDAVTIPVMGGKIFTLMWSMNPPAGSGNGISTAERIEGRSNPKRRPIIAGGTERMR
jgi:hypothetical protein